jgi:photosystem II stability/assembly factor-like uncharacterized protein
LTLKSGAMLLYGMRGHSFRSEDEGRSWMPVETGTEQSLQAGVQIHDGTIVLVGLGGVVAASRDDGRSFVVRTESERKGFAAVAETADRRILLVGEAGVGRDAALPEAPAQVAR